MPYRSGWRPKLGCLLAGCLALGIPVLILALWTMTPPLPLRAFDAAAWRAVSRSDDFSRQEMVGSLLWSDTIEGMSRAEVLALLGPDCECGYFAEWDLVYWLGPERSLVGIDSEWLVIDFDAAGRYDRHALVTD